MQRAQLSAIVLFGGLLAATSVCAQGLSAIQPNDGIGRPTTGASPFMRVFGPAQPPHGFVRFCEEMPKECGPDQKPEARFDASPERLRELDAVNREVNRAITPATATAPPASDCAVGRSPSRK